MPRQRSRGTLMVRDGDTYRRKPRSPKLIEIGRGYFVTGDEALARDTKSALEVIWAGRVSVALHSRRLAPRARKRLYSVSWRVMIPKEEPRPFDQSTSQDTPGFVETFKVEP